MSDNEPLRRAEKLPPTRKRVERELDEELRLHLELRVEDMMRSGMSEGDARAEAMRRFGDIDDARAYCREQDGARVRRVRRGRWLEEAGQDIRFALRQLRRSRAFATAAVLTMAAGIGLSIAAYSMVHAYLLRPLPYPESERLAYIIYGPSRDPFPGALPTGTVRWDLVDSSFTGSVAWDLDGFTLTDGEQPEYVDGAWVTTGYFTTLGLRPAMGRAFTNAEHVTSAPVAIISDALWTRRFGRDSAILGRTIRAYSTDRPADQELVTVIGVMPEKSWHMSRFTDVLRPFAGARMPSIVRIPDSMTLDDAQKAVNGIVLPQLTTRDPAWHLSLVSLHDEVTYQVRPLLLSMLGASLFMLLIGGASVAGALTARAAARRRELELRAALGASRGRIARQYLTESAVLSVLAAAGGAIIALVLQVALGPTLGERLGVPVPNADGRVDLDPLLFATACAMAMLITFVFNVVPAWISARQSGGYSQSGNDRTVHGNSRAPVLRRGLVAGQLALTMLLLVGAGLMIRSVLSINNAPLGFDATNVLKANMLLPLGHYPDSAARVQGTLQVVDALAAEAGVQSVAIVSPHPFRPAGAFDITAEGGDPQTSGARRAAMMAVAGDYMGTLKLTAVRGRAIDATDLASTTPVAVVSEGLASRLWGEGDPIGRRLRTGTQQQWRTVVGVVKDTRKSLAAMPLPDLYVPFAQSPRPFVSVLARTHGDPLAMSAALAARVARVSPVLALSGLESMESVVSRDGQQPRMLAILLGVFATLALSLAILGLYSSLSYLVSLRSRELAVRVAVGATAGAIARLIIGEGARTLAIGLAVGLAASLSLAGLLASQLIGIEPTDPLTFAYIFLVLIATTAIAMILPALRASRVDPAAVLRAD